MRRFTNLGISGLAMLCLLNAALGDAQARGGRDRGDQQDGGGQQQGEQHANSSSRAAH